MNNREIHLLEQEDYCLNKDHEMINWIKEQVGLGRMVTINSIVDINDYIYKLRVRVYGKENA